MQSTLGVGLRLTACAVVAAFVAATWAQPTDARSRLKPSHKSKTVKVPAKKPDDLDIVDSGSKDPMLLVVSLKRQRVQIYRGTTPISSSPISTGRKGYATPTGVFSIVEKKRFHRSNIYSGAPMPFMQRITWSGVALHAGHLPGYPASHGCIRLPASFATKLFSMTKMGVHVLVVPDEIAFDPIEHAGLLQPGRPMALTTSPAHASAPAAAPPHFIRVADASTGAPVVSGSSGTPDEAPNPAHFMGDFETDLARQQTYDNRSPLPLRILVTRRTGQERLKDVQRMLNDLGYNAGEVDGWMGSDTGKAIQAFQNSIGVAPTGTFTSELVEQLYKASGRGGVVEGHIYVRQNMKPVFDAPIRLVAPDRPLGTHFYVAMDFKDGDKRTQWLSATLEDEQSGSATRTLDRIEIPDTIRQRLSAMLTPGSSMVVNDDGLSGLTAPGPRGGTDFVVLTN